MAVVRLNNPFRRIVGLANQQDFIARIGDDSTGVAVTGVKRLHIEGADVTVSDMEACATPPDDYLAQDLAGTTLLKTNPAQIYSAASDGSGCFSFGIGGSEIIYQGQVYSYAAGKIPASVIHGGVVRDGRAFVFRIVPGVIVCYTAALPACGEDFVWDAPGGASISPYALISEFQGSISWDLDGSHGCYVGLDQTGGKYQLTEIFFNGWTGTAVDFSTQVTELAYAGLSESLSLTPTANPSTTLTGENYDHYGAWRVAVTGGWPGENDDPGSNHCENQGYGGGDWSATDSGCALDDDLSAAMAAGQAAAATLWAAVPKCSGLTWTDDSPTLSAVTTHSDELVKYQTWEQWHHAEDPLNPGVFADFRVYVEAEAVGDREYAVNDAFSESYVDSRSGEVPIHAHIIDGDIHYLTIKASANVSGSASRTVVGTSEYLDDVWYTVHQLPCAAAGTDDWYTNYTVTHSGSGSVSGTSSYTISHTLYGDLETIDALEIDFTYSISGSQITEKAYYPLIQGSQPRSVASPTVTQSGHATCRSLRFGPIHCYNSRLHACWLIVEQPAVWSGAWPTDDAVEAFYLRDGSLADLSAYSMRWEGNLPTVGIYVQGGQMLPDPDTAPSNVDVVRPATAASDSKFKRSIALVADPQGRALFTARPTSADFSSPEQGADLLSIYYEGAWTEHDVIDLLGGTPTPIESTLHRVAVVGAEQT